MNLLDLTPRLRMFAGPNGSGKSTIKSLINKDLLGIYINPDDLEAEIKKNDLLDLATFGIQTSEKEILEFFRNSTLLAKADLLLEAAELRFSQDKLDFYAVEVNSYFASVAADFIRQKLILSRQSFTFETVMSSPDKIEFIAKPNKWIIELTSILSQQIIQISTFPVSKIGLEMADTMFRRTKLPPVIIAR